MNRLNNDASDDGVVEVADGNRANGALGEGKDDDAAEEVSQEMDTESMAIFSSDLRIGIP
jgi:hypothetical protein